MPQIGQVPFKGAVVVPNKIFKNLFINEYSKRQAEGPGKKVADGHEYLLDPTYHIKDLKPKASKERLYLWGRHYRAFREYMQKNVHYIDIDTAKAIPDKEKNKIDRFNRKLLSVDPYIKTSLMAKQVVDMLDIPKITNMEEIGTFAKSPEKMEQFVLDEELMRDARRYLQDEQKGSYIEAKTFPAQPRSSFEEKDRNLEHLWKEQDELTAQGRC